MTPLWPEVIELGPLEPSGHNFDMGFGDGGGGPISSATVVSSGDFAPKEILLSPHHQDVPINGSFLQDKGISLA